MGFDGAGGLAEGRWVLRSVCVRSSGPYFSSRLRCIGSSSVDLQGAGQLCSSAAARAVETAGSSYASVVSAAEGVPPSFARRGFDGGGRKGGSSVQCAASYPNPRKGTYLRSIFFLSRAIALRSRSPSRSLTPHLHARPFFNPPSFLILTQQKDAPQFATPNAVRANVGLKAERAGWLCMCNDKGVAISVSPLLPTP